MTNGNETQRMLKRVICIVQIYYIIVNVVYGHCELS
jgi:hypothetical protein